MMVHEHAMRALTELMEVRKTPSGTDLLLHHALEAFDGVEVVAAAGGQDLQAQAPLPMGQRRGEGVRKEVGTYIACVTHGDTLLIGAKRLRFKFSRFG